MDIAEMTVCDADSAITQAGASVRADKNNPYKFYALNGNTIFIVTILMPLGGTQSGLYRFPKVGEKVLVAHTNGNTGHLLGYVPSESQPYDRESAAMDTLIKNQGEVFRYQKTGTNTADKKYSEIGFYNEQTQWKKDGKDTPPPIDRINIQSTGDIHERAQNHHQIQAKRFELLVDCPASAEKRPLGDHVGDDSELYGGDCHIRAKTRLVFKAGDEIRLEVGRSAIVISDDGINIISRKACTNTANPWDTVLNLTPRDGIALFGQKVDIGAAQSFSLRESTGGAISSFGGVMRLGGRDLMAQAYSKYAYQANTADVDKTVNSVFAAMKTETGKTPSFSAMMPSLVGLLTAANWGVSSSGSNYSDAVGDYADYCVHLLEVLSATYTTLDITMPEELREKNGGRDALNQAALLGQYKIIKQMLSYVANAGTPDKAMHNSFIHLTASADAVLAGYGVKHLSAEQTDASAPVAGTNLSLIANETARLSRELDFQTNINGGNESGILKQVEKRAANNNLWAIDIDPSHLEKLKEL
ncbi:MAG: hypothetical protein LBT01_05615 [Spirochaetaceae bacterium]|jgi:hypothetical protein|nr:hypothetical protein [Spirochaetaceae bacterium]